MRRRLTAVCIAAVLLLLAGACGGPASPDHSSTASTSRATSPTTSTSVRSPYLLAPGQVAFLSPSRNISCEIDVTLGTTKDAAFCETSSPAESASLATNGSVKVCGVGCEGNAGEDTPTLGYGRSTGLGPFACRSAKSGITCTASGKGFVISRSGIRPVQAPLVSLAPGSYNGTVDAVGPSVSQMTFTISSTGCNGVPSPGTWSIDLAGATFVANSTPTTEQGQAVTLTPSGWMHEVTRRSAWTVLVASGQPIEVTDGPTC
ncbi:MAG: hypothetical protein ACRDWE_13375 [Acidimicrobiales bacterium]